MTDADREIANDAEARERYPWLDEDGDEDDNDKGGDVERGSFGWRPKEYTLSAKHQKIRDLELAKIAAEDEATVPGATNYHAMDDLTDEHLPELDFRRYDNLFAARPANKYLEYHSVGQRPAKRLFSDFWLEGELSVLFADTGRGKSVLAVQIARAIAGGGKLDPFEMNVPAQRVAYFDFELSDEQFATRYSCFDGTADNSKPLFPLNFIRCAPIDVDSLPPGIEDYHEFLRQSIADFIVFSGAKIVVIDNVTWLHSSTDNSTAALRLMKMLVKLKNRLGLSILVLAHTPKHSSSSGITVNHLQGSKMLANFADNIFAMGQSCQARDLRYLKHIKPRNCALRFDSANVPVIRIGRTGLMLGFEFVEHSTERKHADWYNFDRVRGEAAREEKMRRVLEMADNGNTHREIAAEIGVGLTTVRRYLRDFGHLAAKAPILAPPCATPSTAPGGANIGVPDDISAKELDICTISAHNIDNGLEGQSRLVDRSLERHRGSSRYRHGKTRSNLGPCRPPKGLPVRTGKDLRRPGRNGIHLSVRRHRRGGRAGGGRRNAEGIRVYRHHDRQRRGQRRRCRDPGI